MQSDLDRIKELAQKFLNGDASPGEKKALHEWFDTVSSDELEMVLSPEKKTTEEYGREMYSVLQKEISRNSNDNLRSLPSRPFIASWKKITAAAAILLVVATGSYLFYKSQQDKQQLANTLPYGGDIEAPQQNKSVLILGDGSRIYLDSAANGELTTQGTVTIKKLADGQLAYDAADNNNPASASTNTITVPYGSRPLQLTLSDGSKVWLDVGSSITYPTVFTAGERKVEMTGQSYFEVAPDKTRPFLVSSGDISVRVLGTHFNINSYKNENRSMITLLEGSVQVKNNGSSTLLTPGQQAQIADKGDLSLRNDADLEEVMAWKNGRYELNGYTIEPIMRQIERWYNVTVEFDGPVPSDNFMGGVSRAENVSALLKILEQTQVVKFRVEGKKIIVSKR